MAYNIIALSYGCDIYKIALLVILQICGTLQKRSMQLEHAVTDVRSRQIPTCRMIGMLEV